MRLMEWREYQSKCHSIGCKPKAEARRTVYFRLIDLYGVDAVIRHVELIKKVLQ